MFCMECGEKLPDKAKFCFSCGKKINQDIENATGNTIRKNKIILENDDEIIEIQKNRNDNLRGPIINESLENYKSLDKNNQNELLILIYQVSYSALELEFDFNKLTVSWLMEISIDSIDLLEKLTNDFINYIIEKAFPSELLRIYNDYLQILKDYKRLMEDIKGMVLEENIYFTSENYSIYNEYFLTFFELDNKDEIMLKLKEFSFIFNKWILNSNNLTKKIVIDTKQQIDNLKIFDSVFSDNNNIEKYLELKEDINIIEFFNDINAKRPGDFFYIITYLSEYESFIENNIINKDNIEALAIDAENSISLIPNNKEFAFYKLMNCVISARLNLEIAGFIDLNDDVAEGSEKSKNYYAEKSLSLLTKSLLSFNNVKIQSNLFNLIKNLIRIYEADNYIILNQIDNAFKSINIVEEDYKQSILYQFIITKIFSVKKNYQKAIIHLKEAFNYGYNDINELISDKYLTNLRNDYSNIFNKTIEVLFSWEIKFGFLNDDIILTNNSLFTITNVKLVTNIFGQQNNEVFNLELEVEYILPGEQHMWEDVLSVTGSQIMQKSKCWLYCDQVIDA